MSGGFALESKTKRVSYATLFDWAAERVRLATPIYIVSALMDADGYGYVECLGEYIPRAERKALEVFKQLTREQRIAEAKRWFKDIEPGYRAFGEPAW